MNQLLKFPKQRPEQSLGFLFWQTTNLWQRKISQALKEFDLTHVQFVLLAGVGWLERSEEYVTQKRLSDHAKTDIMMTSKVVRSLEKKQLLIRQPHPIDTRANILQLTENAKSIVEQALKKVIQVDQTFFKELKHDHPEITLSFQNLLKQHGES